MKRIGIIAALPGELKPFVKGWKRIAAAENIFHYEVHKEDALWIAVCAGIGKSAATRAFAEAERAGPMTAVLSIGWAGGLKAGLEAGQVYEVSLVRDAQTGEEFQLLSSQGESGLVTTARVANHLEKERLAEAYPRSMLVDMEAATIVRLAAARNISCYCFKAVSDAVDLRLPDLNPFIDSSGQFRTARFALWSLFRPAYWKALAHFGDNSKRAAENLARTVEKFLVEKGYTQEGR